MSAYFVKCGNNLISLKLLFKAIKLIPNLTKSELIGVEQLEQGEKWCCQNILTVAAKGLKSSDT